MIDHMDGHIPSLLIIFCGSILRDTLLASQKNQGFHPKASKSKLNADIPDRSNSFN